MKVVILCTDDSVHVMSVKKGAIDDSVNNWKAVWPGCYVSHREMPDDAIPTDKYFRGAWTDTTTEPVIDIDMVKARAIHLDRLRTDRDAKLAELDPLYMTATEQGLTDAAKAIADYKQQLRDMPEVIAKDMAAAATPEAIKAINPEILTTAVEASKTALTSAISAVKDTEAKAE